MTSPFDFCAGMVTLGSPYGRAGMPSGMTERAMTPSPPQCAHWGTSPRGRGERRLWCSANFCFLHKNGSCLHSCR